MGAHPVAQEGALPLLMVQAHLLKVVMSGLKPLILMLQVTIQILTPQARATTGSAILQPCMKSVTRWASAIRLAIAQHLGHHYLLLMILSGIR